MLNCPISRLTGSGRCNTAQNFLAPLLTPHRLPSIKLRNLYQTRKKKYHDGRRRLYLFDPHTHLSAFFVEITVGVVVGVLRVGRVGLHSLHPVQKDHESARGETLKQSYVKTF